MAACKLEVLAPQKEFGTGFALNASNNSQEILKKSAQWAKLIPGLKLRFFFFFLPDLFPSGWETRKRMSWICDGNSVLEPTNITLGNIA